MKIYKCIITGDEMTSDTYTITDVPDQPCLMKVTGALATKNSDVIQLEGSNASAEEAPEELEEGGSSQVIDIIEGCRLQSTVAIQANSFKDFRAQMKGFMKEVLKKLEADGQTEKVAEFKENAASALKYIYKNLKDFEFYSGESMNPDGTVGYLNYEEDGVTPYMLFWKHSLVEEKC